MKDGGRTGQDRWRCLHIIFENSDILLLLDITSMLSGRTMQMTPKPSSKLYFAVINQRAIFKSMSPRSQVAYLEFLERLDVLASSWQYTEDVESNLFRHQYEL